MRKSITTISIIEQTESLRDELIQIHPNLNKSTVFDFMADMLLGNFTLDDMAKHNDLAFKDTQFDGRRKI